MTDCIRELSQFLPEKSKNGRLQVESNFVGGEVTSDGGILLLHEFDRKLKLTESIADCFVDVRDPS